MRSLISIIWTLFAVGGRKKQNDRSYYFIDANNLMGHRGIGPKDGNVIAKKLEPIRGCDGVFLVYDGRPGAEERKVSASGNCLQVISLEEGRSADDYIEDEIRRILKESSSGGEKAGIQVVTADRELRRRVLGIKPRIVRNVVNPVTFWRRYLPRLSGLKRPEQEGRKEDEEEVVALGGHDRSDAVP